MTTRFVSIRVAHVSRAGGEATILHTYGNLVMKIALVFALSLALVSVHPG